jgi:hypothetical protein
MFSTKWDSAIRSGFFLLREVPNMNVQSSIFLKKIHETFIQIYLKRVFQNNNFKSFFWKNSTGIQNFVKLAQSRLRIWRDTGVSRQQEWRD